MDAGSSRSSRRVGLDREAGGAGRGVGVDRVDGDRLSAQFPWQYWRGPWLACRSPSFGEVDEPVVGILKESGEEHGGVLVSVNWCQVHAFMDARTKRR